MKGSKYHYDILTLESKYLMMSSRNLASTPVLSAAVVLVQDAVWPGESSGNSCLCWPPDTMWQGVQGLWLLSYAPWLRNLGIKWSRTAVAPPRWPCHDSLYRLHQRQGRNTLSFTTTESWHWLGTLHQSFTVSDSDGMATSCIKSITHFPLSRMGKKGMLWKTWPECVKTDIDRSCVA